MAHKEGTPGARGLSRRLTPSGWSSWLEVLLAVIALGVIALITVLVMREAADTGEECGADLSTERVFDERGVDMPDERLGEETGCSPGALAYRQRPTAGGRLRFLVSPPPTASVVGTTASRPRAGWM